MQGRGKTGMYSPNLSAEAARERVARGARLVDVPAPQALSPGALGAVNIPLPVIQDALQKLEQAESCGAPGGRDGMAKQLPDTSAFAQAYNIVSQAIHYDC